jgi:hypothetical protein
MERTIGNLGQEIWQPSNPFANLAQRALATWFIQNFVVALA